MTNSSGSGKRFIRPAGHGIEMVNTLPAPMADCIFYMIANKNDKLKIIIIFIKNNK
jgi:hypothetical protein